MAPDAREALDAARDSVIPMLQRRLDFALDASRDDDGVPLFGPRDLVRRYALYVARMRFDALEAWRKRGRRA